MAGNATGTPTAPLTTTEMVVAGVVLAGTTALVVYLLRMRKAS